MTLDIVDYQLPEYTHNRYDVTFYDDQIHTLVTHTASYVDTWISEIESIHHGSLNRLIIGLDLEWRPSFNRYIDNRVATLQLCVERRCLIFQLIHAEEDSGLPPQSLVDFLSNPNYTFVGVGIESDVEKLMDDYGLEVANTVDVRGLAAEEYGESDLRNAGLKTLARRVLGKEVEKPRRVTMSRWDNQYLTPVQVQYACIDAFLSFEIGRSLNASGH